MGISVTGFSNLTTAKSPSNDATLPCCITALNPGYAEAIP